MLLEVILLFESTAVTTALLIKDINDGGAVAGGAKVEPLLRLLI